ncbi:MAG: alanine:cation symporter family protein [Myxococcota bacterium]
MKRVLKQTQRYGVVIALVIAVAVIVAVGGQQSIDEAFGHLVDFMAGILLWSPPIPYVEKLPLIVIVLFGGAVFFTFRFGFINIRAFKHAIDVTIGKYDNPDDPGEVSHFQALSSALSATVGLGNIAGVAIAVSVGGPGAIFWMMATAVFGMASKFTECTLGQMYRRVDAKGDVRGGPMVYLRDGIAEVLPSWKWLGVGLSVLFAILCIGASFGGGNMFQANQAFKASQNLMPFLAGDSSRGEVRLTSDEPIDIEIPAQQVRFKTREEVSYYSPKTDEVLAKDDWKELEEQYVTTIPVASQDEEGIWSLGEDGTAMLEVLEQRDDGLTAWAPVSGVSVEGLEKAEGAEHGRVTLSVPVPEEAPEPDEETGELPKDDRIIDFADENIRLRVAHSGGNAPYYPATTLKVSQDDWESDNGSYKAYADVRSAGESAQFDLDPGLLRTMEVAAIEGRQITGWHPVGNVEALNQESISGGRDNTTAGLIFGLVMAFLVGIVIIGGIKSIAKVAEKIVPAMCVMYVVTGILVVILNYELLPEAVGIIFNQAFSLEAGLGALMGIIATGVTRAAFSSEAGIGSAAIAHSAAKTAEPVREGIVALLEPFIDTIVVCFITGIVIVISGAYNDPTAIGMEGVQLTSRAFGSEFGWFPYVLSGAVFLFAYSTMISWSYYGERCWTELFGAEQSMVYRIIFLMFIVLGCVSSLDNVLTFSDFMILSMAFPNIIGLVILSNLVARRLKDYWTSYKNDEFELYE